MRLGAVIADTLPRDAFVIDGRRWQRAFWDVVARMASGRQMALPLALSLNYLANRLDAPLPRAICGRLATIAAHDRSVGPELALHAARAAGGLGSSWDAPARSPAVRRFFARCCYRRSPSRRG